MTMMNLARKERITINLMRNVATERSLAVKVNLVLDDRMTLSVLIPFPLRIQTARVLILIPKRYLLLVNALVRVCQKHLVRTCP